VIGGSWGSEPGEDDLTFHCVRGTDFDYDHLRTDLTRAPLRSYNRAEAGKRVARRGDLLVEKSGGGEQQPVGRVVLHDLDEPVMPTNFVGRLRPAPGVNPRFACYLLASLYSDGRTRATIKQTTGIQNLDLDALLTFRVYRPDADTQSAIADYLDTETARIDTLIEKWQRMVKLFGERDMSLLSTTLLPANARFAPLGYFASLQTGITIDANRDPGPDRVTRPYLRVANVQAGWLDLDDITEVAVSAGLAKRCALRPGDVLMTEGGDLDKLGRGTLWEGQLPGCLHQNHIFAVRTDDRRLNSKFLALFTGTAHARRYFESTGVRTTNLASTNSSKILGLPVPVLPLDEQARIVATFQAAAKHTSILQVRLTRQIDLLVEHRQALITAAVTGELSVPGVAA
jgi:type I restriction enzyme S subunit